MQVLGSSFGDTVSHLPDCYSLYTSRLAATFYSSSSPKRPSLPPLAPLLHVGAMDKAGAQQWCNWDQSIGARHVRNTKSDGDGIFANF